MEVKRELLERAYAMLSSNKTHIRVVMSRDETCVAIRAALAAPAAAPEQPASKALQDVAAERQRQDAKWGGPKHDDWHSVSDWRRFIACRLNRIPTDAIPPNALPIGTRPKDRQEERKMLIEIGALAVAAAEGIDREAGRFRADGFPAWICDACKTPKSCASTQACETGRA